MLSREDWYMINQMSQRGCFVKDIAAEVGCSERTVRRALQRQGPPPARKAGVRPSKLDPFKEQIDRLLADQVWNAEVILAEIRQQGYTGQGSILRDYIRPKRALRPSKATVRFETAPGRQLQHDWGELMVEIGGEFCKVYVAVNTLGYSRRFHAWAAPSLDAEHTYEALIRSFEYFGGVPQEVLVDNQKAAVLSHPASGVVRFNEGFLALANHYGFQPRACKPMRPRTKGKTERMVGYVKHNFFVRYRSFDSWAHLNQLLEHWLTEVADPRKPRELDEVVAVRFERERPTLQALPAHRFDTSYHELRQVAWDGYIEVRGNRYSVPAAHCGQTVVVRIGLDGQLRILDGQGQALTEHRLQERQAGWQRLPEHHRVLWDQVQVQQRDLRQYVEVA